MNKNDSCQDLAWQFWLPTWFLYGRLRAGLRRRAKRVQFRLHGSPACVLLTGEDIELAVDLRLRTFVILGTSLVRSVPQAFIISVAKFAIELFRLSCRTLMNSGERRLLISATSRSFENRFLLFSKSANDSRSLKWHATHSGCDTVAPRQHKAPTRAFLHEPSPRARHGPVRQGRVTSFVQAACRVANSFSSATDGALLHCSQAVCRAMVARLLPHAACYHATPARVPPQSLEPPLLQQFPCVSGKCETTTLKTRSVSEARVERGSTRHQENPRQETESTLRPSWSQW